MSHWQFKAHVLQPSDYGQTCIVCGRSWVKQPQSDCPGLMMYAWGKWPEHLLTKKQLNEAGFSTTAKTLPAPAGAVWREKSPDGLMFLYDRNTATPKRVLSEEEKAVRAAVAQRLKDKWKCPRCSTRKERLQWDYCEDCGNHVEARDWARELLERKGEILILDTETSGLDAGYNEIIELAVIDGTGATLLDTRIKPLHPDRMLERGDSGRCATDIHGIHPDALVNAPDFAEVYAELFRVLHDKTVLIYNASYDRGMLNGDRRRYELPGFGVKEWIDVIEPYAAWCGQRRYERYGRSWSYRWQPLGGGDHSALGDCLAVIATLEEMAEMEVESG